MGCGKSTMGRAVSSLTGLPFIDLDNYIECRYHLSVREIFARYGEDGFRDIERRMLQEVSDFEDVIVAGGGGTPCFFDNMEYMNSHGITVFLNTPIPRLFSRLKRGKAKRPLIAEKNDEELLNFIQEALNARMKYYSQAQIEFSSEFLENVSEIDRTARKFIEELSIEYKSKD